MVVRGKIRKAWNVPSVWSMGNGCAEGGSILILTLWTLLFLSVLALAVASHVQAALSLASVLKADKIAYYAARAGVERGIMEVLSNSNSWDSVLERWSDNKDVFKDIAVGEGFFTLSRVEKDKYGEDIIKYGLIDEESRISINSKHINSSVLEAMLERIGELDDEESSKVANAILDWRDSDDRLLTDGAENGYYANLNPPYACANAPFLSAQELMLVKGVDPKLFQKIDPYITVFGSGAVNINTAGRAVLACLADAVGGQNAGVSDSLAEKIIVARRHNGVFEKAEFEAIRRVIDEGAALESLELKVLNDMMRYITVRSSCFRGVVSGCLRATSTAGMNDEAIDERTIVFVFDRDKRENVLWFER